MWYIFMKFFIQFCIIVIMLEKKVFFLSFNMNNFDELSSTFGKI